MDILKYIVDIAYLLTAVIIIIVFTTRGFFDSVSRFGKYIAAALLSYSLGPALGGFLYRKWIFNLIAVPVTEKIAAFLSNTIGSIDVDSMINALPAVMQKLIDADAIKAKYGTTVENIDGMAEDFSATVSSPLAGFLSNLLAYAAIFFLSMLVLSLLFNLLNRIFELPGLNVVNHLLGTALGVLAAFLVLAAVTWLLGALISLFGSTGKLAEFTGNSRLFGYFSKLNLFKLFQSAN